MSDVYGARRGRLDAFAAALFYSDYISDKDNMKKIIALVCLGLLGVTAQAKVKPVVYYNFGEVANVSFATAPNEIKPSKGNILLSAVGAPLFYADAPSDKAAKGHGSILFDGKADGYRTSQAIGMANENMVLEVWVKARELDKGTGVVVANGNGKGGYTIAQRNKEWILISGGTSVVKVGEVVKGQWTHLAAVIENGSGSVWMNGKKTKTFGTSGVLSDNFSVAISDEGKEPFHGEIYEIRYSTFNNGEFKPDADFLLNYKVIKQKDNRRLAERKTLIRQLEAPGLGKTKVSDFSDRLQGNDWLIRKVDDPCRLLVKTGTDNVSAELQLHNGLVSRTFYIGENVACVGYRNLSNGAEYLRAVKPEARVCLDSVWYEVGGLKGQPEMSYLIDNWYPQLEASSQAFTLQKIETGMPLERYPWKQKYNAQPADWPAKGLRMEMTFVPTDAMTDVKDIEIKINYEIYQGMPVIAKWMEVINKNEKKVLLNDMECEILAVNQDQVKRMHVESNYSFAVANAQVEGSALVHFETAPKPYAAGGSTTKWEVDLEYNTWATHNQAEDKFLDYPHHCLLISKLPMGPYTMMSNIEPFKSHVTFELLQDSDDRERQTLGHRRLYRKLAPQTTESLLGAGITSHDEKVLKDFIDQMAEVGMERLDIMAWPGVSHDNLDPEYLRLWRTIADYAKERGIIMGGYELQVASRGRGDEVDTVHPETGEVGSIFGRSVCVASSWQDTYFSNMWKFFDETGFKTYNMDGPYHGDPCGATNHTHHIRLEDSQWQQWSAYVKVLHELQRRDIYVPIPDWYFLNGQCSTGMGYREASSNLSPQQQQLLGRQYIYDGTWHKLPTMGWMTLQLVGFYTNDKRVGLEPLCENLDKYESQLMQFLGSGCLLTIRGNRLYDTSETKAMLTKCLDWYRKYRDILTSEIIHVSRPTGRDLDCMMHANPFIDNKGMVMIFNPTERDITKNIKLPLYYTGVQGKATVTDADGNTKVYQLNRKEELTLPVSLKAGATTWFLIQE